MTIGKNNKMMAHLGWRMKVIVQDSRTFVGYFKAFDKHMNVILSDCEEIRKIKPKPGKKLVNEEEKRTLGLVLLRGDKIISISVDGPAQKDDDSRVPKAGGSGGPGQAKPATRSVPQLPTGAPAGLQGPLGGHGIPGMQPPYGVPPMGQPPRPF